MTSINPTYIGSSKVKLNTFVGVPIKNDLGEQNCFLNVLIHLIYNIDEIKKFLLEEETKKEENYGLLNALKEVLENYQLLQKDQRTEKMLDPFELRKELGDLFQKERKFCLRKMEDPVEALIVIINAFHSFFLGEKSLKNVVERHCQEKCLAHQLFWINIFQQDECECGASSEVLKYDYNYFLYEAYVKEILNSCDKESLSKINQKFMKFLKKINMQTKSVCPEKCSLNKVTKNLFILNNPKYLIFNLTWEDSSPLLEDICKLYFCLPTTFRIDDLYNVPDNNRPVEYEMFGLICYWGAHYVCYVKHKHEKLEFWENYDDNTIIKINDWSELIKKAIKSHLHPVVLFYKTKVDKKQSNYASSLSSKDQEEILKYCKKIDLEKKLKRNETKNSKVCESPKLDNSEFTLFSHLDKDKDKNVSNNNRESFIKNQDNGSYLSKNKTDLLDGLELNRTKSGEEWVCDNCNEVNYDYSSFICKKGCKIPNENIKLIIHQQNYFKNNQKKLNEFVKNQSVSKYNCSNCGKILIDNKCSFCDSRVNKSKEEKLFCIDPICKKEINKTLNKCDFCKTEYKSKESISSELLKKKKRCSKCLYEFYVDSNICLKCGFLLNNDHLTSNNNIIERKQSDNIKKCILCNNLHDKDSTCIIPMNKSSIIYCDCSLTKKIYDRKCLTCCKPIKIENVKILKCITCNEEIDQSLSTSFCRKCMNNNYRSRSQIHMKEKTQETKELNYYSKSQCISCKKEINNGSQLCQTCSMKNNDNNKRISNTITQTQIKTDTNYKIPLQIPNKSINITNNFSQNQQTPKNTRLDPSNNGSFRKQTVINQSINIKNNYSLGTKSIPDERKLAYSSTMKNEKTQYLESPYNNKQSTNIYPNHKSVVFQNSTPSKFNNQKSMNRYASTNPKKNN